MSGSRERILDAGEQLFAELGFDATPTARIAELAQVPKGLVFHYFPRKLDLLAALAVERHSDLPAPPVRPGRRARRVELTSALLSLAEHLQDTQAPLHRILLHDGHQHRVLAAGLDRLHEQVTAVVRAIIDHTLPPPPPDDDTREAAAITFTAAVFHALRHRQLTGIGYDLRPVAATVAAGLAPRRG
jgi:AcrR family transcriptional regulator